MDSVRLHRGRRKRGVTVHKIIDAFDKGCFGTKLTFTELKSKTGLTPKILTSVLKELEELGSVFQEKEPRGYVFIGELTDDEVKIAEKAYENEYQTIIRFLSPVSRIEHNAKRAGVKYLENEPKYTEKKLRPIALRKIRLEHYKLLRECHYHLHTLIEAEKRSDDLPDWADCVYCRFSRKTEKDKFLCTFEWQAGGAKSEREHTPKKNCDNFEVRRF